MIAVFPHTNPFELKQYMYTIWHGPLPHASYWLDTTWFPHTKKEKKHLFLLTLSFLAEFLLDMTYLLCTVHEPFSALLTVITFKLAVFESMGFIVSFGFCSVLGAVWASQPWAGMFFDMPVSIPQVLKTFATFGVRTGMFTFVTE